MSDDYEAFSKSAQDDDEDDMSGTEDLRRLEVEEENLKMLKKTLMKAENFRHEILERDLLIARMQDRLDFLENEQVILHETRLENQTLSDRVRTLERSITESFAIHEQLSKQCSNQSATSDNLHEEVDRLSGALAESRSQADSYAQEISHLRSESQSRAELKHSEVELRVLKEQESFREREIAFRTELNEKSVLLTKALSDVQLYSERNSVLVGQLADMDTRLKQQESGCSHWRKEAEEAKLSVVEKDSEVGHWKHMYNDLEAVVQALSNQIATMLRAHNEEASKLQKELKEKTREATESQIENASMNDALVKFVTETDVLLNSYAKRAHLDDDPDLAGDLSTHELSTIRSEHEANLSQISHSLKSNDLVRVVDRMSRLLENMVRYRSDRDFLRTELQKASNTVDSAGKILQRLEGKLKRARAELESADTVMKSVTDQLVHIVPSASSFVAHGSQHQQQHHQALLPQSMSTGTSTPAQLRALRAHGLEKLNKLALSAVQHFMSVQSECMRYKDQSQELSQELERHLIQSEESHKESLREFKRSVEEEYDMHRRDLTTEVEERLRAALYEKTVAVTRLDDTSFCLEALVSHTIRLETRTEDLLVQKKLLTDLCAGYNKLREEVSDLAAGCVETSSSSIYTDYNNSSSNHNGGKIDLEYSPLLANVIRGNGNGNNSAGLGGKVPTTPGLFRAGVEVRGWRIGLAQRGFDGHNIRYYLPSLRIIGIMVVASVRLRKLGDLHRRKKITRDDDDDDDDDDDYAEGSTAATNSLRLVFDNQDDSSHLIKGHSNNSNKQLELDPGCWVLPPTEVLQTGSAESAVKLLLNNVRLAIDGRDKIPAKKKKDDKIDNRKLNYPHWHYTGLSLLDFLTLGNVRRSRRGYRKIRKGTEDFTITDNEISTPSIDNPRACWNDLRPWSMDLYGRNHATRVKLTLERMFEKINSMKENVEITASRYERQQKYLDEAMKEADLVLQQQAVELNTAENKRDLFVAAATASASASGGGSGVAPSHDFSPSPSSSVSALRGPSPRQYTVRSPFEIPSMGATFEPPRPPFAPSVAGGTRTRMAAEHSPITPATFTPLAQTMSERGFPHMPSQLLGNTGSSSVQSAFEPLPRSRRNSSGSVVTPAPSTSNLKAATTAAASSSVHFDLVPEEEMKINPVDAATFAAATDIARAEAAASELRLRLRQLPGTSTASTASMKSTTGFLDSGTGTSISVGSPGKVDYWDNLLGINQALPPSISRAPVLADRYTTATTDRDRFKESSSFVDTRDDYNTRTQSRQQQHQQTAGSAGSAGSGGSVGGGVGGGGGGVGGGSLSPVLPVPITSVSINPRSSSPSPKQLEIPPELLHLELNSSSSESSFGIGEESKKALESAPGSKHRPPERPTFMKIYTDVGKLTRQVERRIRHSNAAFKSSIDADVDAEADEELEQQQRDGYGNNIQNKRSTHHHRPGYVHYGHNKKDLKGFSDSWTEGKSCKFTSRMKKHAEKLATERSRPVSIHGQHARPEFVGSQYYGLN